MKYEITKEQILEIIEWGNPRHAKMVREEWFPEAFETVLEVGKWYFQTDSKALVNYQGGSSGYGFCALDMEYTEEYHHWSFETHGHEWREATESEVFEALKNEAVKRGFVLGAYTKGFEGSENYIVKEGFDIDNYHLKVYVSGSFYKKINIFDLSTGEWAIATETITKEEAEKLLNKKIV